MHRHNEHFSIAVLQWGTLLARRHCAHVRSQASSYFIRWQRKQFPSKSCGQQELACRPSCTPRCKAECRPTCLPLLLRLNRRGHTHPANVHCRHSTARLLFQWISDKCSGSLQFDRSPEAVVKQAHECLWVALWSRGDTRNAGTWPPPLVTLARPVALRRVRKPQSFPRNKYGAKSTSMSR
jgi:hypothetical protein